MTHKLLPLVQDDEDKPVSTDTKVSVKQKAKSEALELATILYDIYTKERDSARVISGQNNDIMS
jgi:hypothetical protein